MAQKLRNWRHYGKSTALNSTGDTPKTIRARMGEENLRQYDPLDLAVLLEKWCNE